MGYFQCEKYESNLNFLLRNFLGVLFYRNTQGDITQFSDTISAEQFQQLNNAAIDPNAIVGYFQEEYTHLGVAAAVASGRADCGLGIAAAAKALDLDFIPLFYERYDLVTPKAPAGSELLAPLFGLLVDPDFRKAVSQLSGYDVSVMGTSILED